MAVQTSGTIYEIDDFGILKTNDKLANEPPVTKYHDVNASLSLMNIDHLNFVFAFRILGLTKINSWLNISGCIL